MIFSLTIDWDAILIIFGFVASVNAFRFSVPFFFVKNKG